MNPFSDDLLTTLARQHGTPLWVYDAATIRQRIAELRAFDTVRYAQKANSNLSLLKLMREQGAAVDAVSRGEIERALAAGYTADPMPGSTASAMVFTADLLDAETLATVVRHRVPVNAGSIDMLHQLGAASPGHAVWLRINPGFGHGHSNKTNTGGEHSKHGIWHAALGEALDAVQQHGLKLVGLHMHIGSGVDYGHLQQVCRTMVQLVAQAGAARLPDLHAISAGGGLSIPYQADQPRIDTAHYFSLWDAARREVAALLGRPVALEIEPGRYLVAESGALLTEVRAIKSQGSQRFTLVDAGFNDLMRPAMYGAHHGMSLIAGSNTPPISQRPLRETVVAGPLCESGDVFTQAEGGVVLTRALPEAQVGDLLVIHDAGAYGASMSSNYNTRGLAAEVLVDGGAQRLIRRRQTVAELLALEAV